MPLHAVDYWFPFSTGRELSSEFEANQPQHPLFQSLFPRTTADPVLYQPGSSQESEVDLILGICYKDTRRQKEQKVDTKETQILKLQKAASFLLWAADRSDKRRNWKQEGILCLPHSHPRGPPIYWTLQEASWQGTLVNAVCWILAGAWQNRIEEGRLGMENGR